MVAERRGWVVSFGKVQLLVLPESAWRNTVRIYGRENIKIYPNRRRARAAARAMKARSS